MDGTLMLLMMTVMMMDDVRSCSGSGFGYDQKRDVHELSPNAQTSSIYVPFGNGLIVGLNFETSNSGRRRKIISARSGYVGSYKEKVNNRHHGWKRQAWNHKFTNSPYECTVPYDLQAAWKASHRFQAFAPLKGPLANLDKGWRKFLFP